MASFEVEPVSFWVGMVMTAFGLFFFGAQFTKLQTGGGGTWNLAATVAVLGWFVLLLSAALGSRPKAARRGSDEPAT